jgi:DMSO/TMAO reductase YedYZ molybdopterin-dependent catalytic subunit
MESRKLPVIIVILSVLFVVIALSGCTSSTSTVAPTPTSTPIPTVAQPSEPAPGTAIVVNGAVNTPLSLYMSDLKSYAQYTVTWGESSGNPSFSGIGARVTDLLNNSSVKAGATNVVFADTKGNTHTISLADLYNKYGDSIVAYTWSGNDKSGGVVLNTGHTFQLIVPHGSDNDQVGSLYKITVS